jgi:protein Hikeshi
MHGQRFSSAAVAAAVACRLARALAAVAEDSVVTLGRGCVGRGGSDATDATDAEEVVRSILSDHVGLARLLPEVSSLARVNMFACLAAGRAVQTAMTVVGPGQYVCVLPDAKTVHHMVVFLTGQQPFEPGLAATVHFGWPAADGVIGWQYLGFLSNDKPSAVFKVAAYKAAIALEESSMVDGSIPAHVGIAVTTLAAVQAAAEAAAAANAQSLVRRPLPPQPPPLVSGPVPEVAPPSATDLALVARRVVAHFYNFVMSYINGPGNEALERLVQAWYQAIEVKFRTDPDFWRRDVL